MLGEFFVARENEVDEQLLEAPFEYLETVEAKGLSEVTFATLGEILGLGTYRELVNQFIWSGTAGREDSGWCRLPRTFRDGLAAVVDVDSAARRSVATEELRLDEWQFEDGERVLREVSALARHAREEDRDLWYWWSI